MGSRFGGLKQIAPVDDYGHILIDYSLFDAWKAGFRKVVFIIKKEIEADFKEVIGTRMEQYFEVHYVYQEVTKLPDGFAVPEDRVKPWGTGHAIACAKDVIDGPFAVINADDYYGAHAFEAIYQFLSNDDVPGNYAMVGYELSNTVTENGSVARGVCCVENGLLKSVTERTHIEKRGEDAAYTEDGRTFVPLSGKTVVSMNLWGFRQDFLADLERDFKTFLTETVPNNPLKSEFFLPFVANDKLQRGECAVTVLMTVDMWYGMTYADDLPKVVDALGEKRKQGLYPEGLWLEPKAAYQFPLEGTPISIERYGCGHINQTYLLVTTTGRRYILQRISDAFDVDVLMTNIAAVTAFTSVHTDDPRGAMKLVPTLKGENYYHDATGNYRVYDYVENSVCLQAPECPEDFYRCAVAFGTFQKMLSSFPAETLGEPIKNFHNTPDRYRIFQEVLEKDTLDRAKDVQAEIAFALAHEQEAHTLQDMRESGELPLRVTHNDTKLNNILLDEKTREPLCVIDLDTVMPGLSVYDFGDSIRFGASTAAEDEKDLSKVTINLDLYRIFAKGFMEACDLTDKEKEMMPMGAKMMTLECGVRFLTDYLDGDHYFATHYEGQNLDRCRTQFKLVSEMEKYWNEMKLI